MIPKVVHLCWLSGDPYPEKIEKCLSTWKKHLPDYEIMLWDTERFDVNSTLWTRQAFEAKKYAFVADYIRFYAVYNYGGIYLDSDIEILKDFDDLLDLPYFIGKESNDIDVEVASFGAEKGTEWVKYCMDYYSDRPFIKPDGSMDTVVCPKIIQAVIKNYYKRIDIKSKADFISDPNTVCIFPMDWFCAHALAIEGTNGPNYKVSDNTYSVHHFAHYWNDHFPGGPLHWLYYFLTRKDWHPRYHRFYLIQETDKHR